MIWVGGENFDISSVKGKDAFKREWVQALWKHFSAHFNPPQTKREWTERLNKSNPMKEILKEKRTELWNEAHSSGEEKSNEADLFSGIEE